MELFFQGIQKVEFHAMPGSQCNGLKLRLKLIQDQETCQLKPKAQILGGQVLTWLTSQDLSNCQLVNFNTTSGLYAQTTIFNTICIPEMVKVVFDDKDRTVMTSIGHYSWTERVAQVGIDKVGERVSSTIVSILN